MLDGVSLHIGGGYWGTLGVSVFKENGLFLNPCGLLHLYGEKYLTFYSKNLYFLLSFLFLLGIANKHNWWTSHYGINNQNLPFGLI